MFMWLLYYKILHLHNPNKIYVVIVFPIITLTSYANSNYLLTPTSFDNFK